MLRPLPTRTAGVLLGAVLSACGPTSAPPRPPRETAPGATSAGPRALAPLDRPVERRDEAPLEEVPAASTGTSDAELDAMDRAELESRCLSGSMAACDRLGH